MHDQTDALKAATSNAKSTGKDEQATLKTMQQHLAAEKKDASTQPMTCYVATGTVACDYNGTLHYDYTGTLPYQRKQFASATDAAAKSEADGSAAAKQATNTGAALQRAISAATYPVPALRTHPGDEKPVVDAFTAGVQAAHADLGPLAAADADVQQQADTIMAQGQAVLDGAKAAVRC